MVPVLAAQLDRRKSWTTVNNCPALNPAN